MDRVLNCLTVEHDIRMVALAGVLCFLSSLLAIVLMQRARASADRSVGFVWLATAGAAAGFGIWATHFVAMLAFTTLAGAVYAQGLTFASLLIAIGVTTSAIALMTFMPGRATFIAAGMLFGAGVSSMHFTGMAATEFGGTFEWDRSLVSVAIVMAVLMAVAGFFAVSNAASGKVRIFLAALSLTLGIVSMHFTAMGAAGVTGHPGMPDIAGNMSPVLMVVSIAAVSLILLSAGFSAAIWARKTELAILSGEMNFRMLVQGVTDYAIYMLDTDGYVSNWNAGAERAKGYTAGEIVGEHFSRFYSAQDRDNGLPARALTTALTTGKFEAEGWRLRKDGSRFWAHVVIDPIFNESGEHIGFAKITRDRTEHMENALRLRRTTENLALALENMANGICLYDSNETIVLHNPRVREIFGIPADIELVGMDFRALCELRMSYDADNDGDPVAFYNMNRALVRRPGGGEYVRRIANGKIVRTVHRPVIDGGWVSTVEDITERVEAENRISHLARHDALTGLPNRRYLLEKLDSALAAADRKGEKLAAICIDLDGFKEVNDTFGHSAGDAMLCGLAQRMLDISGAEEMVGRVGGDEFVAFRPFSTDSELQDFVGRLMTALTERLDVGHSDITPAASLGIAIYPQDADERDKLLADADMAMYRSKASLDEKISYYEASMDEAARERRALGRDLWKAIDNGEFYLAYQSQRSIRTDEITGYEVLLRWQHPVHGLISPAVFIPVAEECGAISAIGDWVLENACREAAAWPIGYRIAVNLSPLQLGNIGLAEKVRRILFETGLPASRLELEVTESAIIGDKTRALHILRQIKALGVTIAIDDFGTGYSSLETLRSFPFDKIKLDRSFVTGLETCRQSKAFVRAIVALGKSLQVSVLAEGVETEEQMRVLQAEDCDEVQGFLFGKPGKFSEQVTPGRARSVA